MVRASIGQRLGLSGALFATWLSALTPMHAAESLPPSMMSIDVVMPPNKLPALSARVMREEVSRIWAREGVAVTWRSSERQVAIGGRFVRLSFIDAEERPQRPLDSYILGDFQADERRIRISLFAAARTATAGTAAYRRPRESFQYPLALGYVLGRAVAHEVGHALLGRSHSETGLMEAAFPPGAMTDSHSPRFRLNDEDSARLTSQQTDVRLARRDPIEGLGVDGVLGETELLTR